MENRKNDTNKRMVTFLKELAEKVLATHATLDDVTVVFPNRRAVLYFRKHLGDLLDKPAFSPKLLTIEDFVGMHSTLKVLDKVELVFELYKVYSSIVRKTDPEAGPGGLEEFYFWGEMLLRDFDEIDKYLVDATQLFKDLSHQKELDSNFDFLTEEQRNFLTSFWSNFDVDQSVNQKKFLKVWKQLPEVYAEFRTSLHQRGFAFKGMLHRIVAEGLRDLNQTTLRKNVVFAGFNALTRAEEKIIAYYVEQANATVYWDMDAYYVNNVAQEAGKFFREYQLHPVLGRTFPADIPAHFQEKNENGERKKVNLFGAAQPIGQAKLMAQILREQLDRGINPEETLVVLPDEKLLFPVLHGISGAVEKLNVTMGFPLSSTPMFNFIELLMDLQINRKGDHFNHRQVLALMGHPYVVAADAGSSNVKRKEILKHNWVHIPKSYLATETELHRLIFHEIGALDLDMVVLIDYLRTIIAEVGALKTISYVDKEYAVHFIKFLNRLQDVLGKDEKSAPVSSAKEAEATMKSFLRLLRLLIRPEKIPFTGEPLRGLQVMGVLETRNLDYKNVFVLSLNEGAFPAMGSKGSYVPFSIRKAYGLPTIEHQDAIYSYLFYRVLQRAQNIFLFYNSETDVLGQGEMSRYLQQLIFESGLKIEQRILHNPVQPHGITPISIPKNKEVLENLAKLNEGNSYFVGISPSALNTYIECRLKFYLRHVAKIKEADEVEEELDARVLGNFLHDVMEVFYKRIRERKKSKQIDASDFENYETVVDGLIDETFIQAYRLNPNKKVEYEGQRLVVKEVVKRFAHRIIEIDKEYAPFSIEAVEQGGLTLTLKLEQPPHKAVIGGKIDRVDLKGDLLRVIDYKTGKDKLSFESVASLFARDSKRNKAAFQTLLYALLYKQNIPANGQTKIRMVPGLINRLNLFDDGFTFGLRVAKEHVSDVDALLPEFESHLKNLFEELFNPDQIFDQTSDIENCKLCAYSQICYRG
jgi:hypothetical protein